MRIDHEKIQKMFKNTATSMFGNSVILQQILQLGPLAKEQGPDKSCTLNFEPGRTF